jgi:hypothetical protein
MNNSTGKEAGGPRCEATLGKRGKPPPYCESGSRVALRFSAREKILNVSQWIHLRFFPALKIKYQPYLHFLATGRFCLASLGVHTTGIQTGHAHEPKAQSLDRPLLPGLDCLTFCGAFSRLELRYKGSKDFNISNPEFTTFTRPSTTASRKDRTFYQTLLNEASSNFGPTFYLKVQDSIQSRGVVKVEVKGKSEYRCTELDTRDRYNVEGVSLLFLTTVKHCAR